MAKQRSVSVSRRGFLKQAIAAGAGLAVTSLLSGCTPAAAPTAAPTVAAPTDVPTPAPSSSTETSLLGDLTRFKDVELSVVTSPGQGRAVTESCVQSFRELSGAKIELVDYPRSEMTTKYVTTFLSGKHQYDVVCMLNEMAPQFYKALVPLDEYVAEAEFDLPDFMPALIEMWRLPKPEDPLYLLPYRWGADILHYRKDLFEEYNLKAPTTWEEYLEAAKTITTETNGEVIGTDLKLKRGYDGLWYYCNYLWGAGGDISDWDYQKGYLDSEYAVAAAEQIQSLLPYAPTGVANWTNDEQITNFSQGRTAMCIAYSPYGHNYSKPDQSTVAGKVGWALGPRRFGDQTPGSVNYPGDSCTRWAQMSAWGYGVTNTSPNKEAALALVLHIASKQMQLATAKDFDNVPARQSTFDDPELHASLSEKGMDEWVETVIAGGNHGRPSLGYNGHHSEMVEVVQVQVQEACLGDRPAAEALKEANEALEAFLADVVRA